MGFTLCSGRDIYSTHYFSPFVYHRISGGEKEHPIYKEETEVNQSVMIRASERCEERMLEMKDFRE